jgi:2-haloacid dehalogenase
VLGTSLATTARRLGIPLEDAAVERVFASWGAMPVFADVVPALEALRERGWRLAALTNCDEDLFAQTRATLPALDFVMTSEAVGGYKPAHGHFERFASHVGEVERWVHVAESYIADVVPAHRLGIPCIWIDRVRSGNDPSLATARLPDLRALPQAVEAVACASNYEQEPV